MFIIAKIQIVGLLVIYELHDDIISANIEALEVILNTTVGKVNTIPGWDSSVMYKK